MSYWERNIKNGNSCLVIVFMLIYLESISILIIILKSFGNREEKVIYGIVASS